MISRKYGYGMNRLKSYIESFSAFEAYETIATIANLLGVSTQTAFRNIEKEYEARKKEESTDDRD